MSNAPIKLGDFVRYSVLPYNYRVDAINGDTLTLVSHFNVVRTTTDQVQPYARIAPLKMFGFCFEKTGRFETGFFRDFSIIFSTIFLQFF